MAKRIEGLVLVALFLILAACVEMRDYTGERDGAFGLDVKTGFDEGADKKDYHLFEDGVGLVIGDTKNEVTLKIGLPDKVDTTFEGYETWEYDQRKIKLVFREERLNGWSFP